MEQTRLILKKIFVTSLLVFFVIGAFILLAPNKKKLEAEAAETAFASALEMPAPINVNSVALSGDGQSTEAEKNFNYCRTLKENLPTLEDYKKTQRVSERFVNVHKKVNGTIFRLRFFYKDHAEGETPNYLLYIEDPNEVAHLMEKSQYKKGAEYSRIEKSAGEILYSEKGINIGEDESLFLHYVNDSLKGLQGSVPELDSKAFIDCRF